jgi:hypothetical protein
MKDGDTTHDDLVERVRDTLAAQGPDASRLGAMRRRVTTSASRGATTLREAPSRRGWWIGSVTITAAASLMLFLLLPTVDRQTTVSAAEILGRSRAALAAPAAGIEVLTYDLAVEGVLADLLPSEQAGRLTVEELIDHDHPGRYRLLKMTADGEIVGAIADDPLRGTRVRYLRAHGRGYLLRFTDAGAAALSFPALKRVALQAFIALMEAETNQAVRDIPCGAESCYEITLPQEPPGMRTPLVSLARARAVVTSTDARLIEFSAAGQIADRPFGIEFTLTHRGLRTGASVTDADFDIAPRPGDVVLEGNASSNPMWDVVERTLAAIPREPAR